MAARFVDVSESEIDQFKEKTKEATNQQCNSTKTISRLRRRANARNVSTSFLPYGGITHFINSFDYPNLFSRLRRLIVN